MTPTARRESLRAALAGDACLHPASVFDPLSARIAADLGFELGMFAGSTASLTVLGAPDLIVLTLSEFAEQARRICRAGAPPLLVDADHGYGNALNVRRTVEELEHAGVAGLTIEDTELPLSYGGKGAALVSIEEGVGKMRAALSARTDPSLVIVGRTSAAEIAGVDAAIARLQAYEAAGVDALFMVGVKQRAQLEAIAAATTLPLILGTASGDMLDAAWLATQRVRICLLGHQPIMAAAQAVRETMVALRAGKKPAVALPEGVTRKADYDAWTRDFLGR